jgi:hypothetical protein
MQYLHDKGKCVNLGFRWEVRINCPCILSFSVCQKYDQMIHIIVIIVILILFNLFFFVFYDSSGDGLPIVGISRHWILLKVRIEATRPSPQFGGSGYLCPIPRSKPVCYGWPYQQLAAAAIVTSDTQYMLIMPTLNNVMTKTKILNSAKKKLC